MVDNRKYLQFAGERRRKQHCQYFTPPEVASFMADWVSGSGLMSIFDPAFGLGAFFYAASKDSSLAFAGCEIDSCILDYWKNTHKGDTDFVENGDYLLSWNNCYENIVCNPPYMRFQKFHNRDAAFSAFQKHLNLRLSGYTNAASAFLIKSLSELSESGRLAYIMPLEFLNTGYGAIVKERLIGGGHLRAIVSIQCEKEVFPDVITSSGIILYDAAATFDHVDFYVLSSVSDLATMLSRTPTNRVPLTNLNACSKWLRFFDPSLAPDPKNGLVEMSYYGNFHRGVATGANAFFVLRPSRVEELELQSEEFIPCVTKSNQIRKPIFGEKDFRELQACDQPVCLFHASAGDLSGNARNYIHLGESRDYHLRYLTKTRKPWYKTEHRTPSPLLLGVFSRDGYKIVRNTSNAITLTCFHGFQPNLFGSEYVDRIFLFLLSAEGRKIVSRCRRQYGDGLDKYEPGDINGAQVPSPEVLGEISEEDVQEAMEGIRETGNVPHKIDRIFGQLN